MSLLEKHEGDHREVARTWLAGLNETIDRQPQRSREEDYNPPDISVMVEDIPRSTTWDCKHCKMPTDGKTTYGRLRNPKTMKDYPCPVCSPPAIQEKARREATKLIKVLVDNFLFPNLQNLPDGSDQLSLDDYPEYADQQAKHLVEEFVMGLMREMFLFGEAGRGKTGLAISAIRELTAQGKLALFLPIMTYIELLREETYKHQIKTIIRLIEYLFIDDLGTETPTRATLRDIQELIEIRHNAPGCKTFITSNMPFSQLELYWHLSELGNTVYQPAKRTISRLKGYYTCYEITGKDLRQIQEDDE